MSELKQQSNAGVWLLKLRQWGLVIGCLLAMGICLRPVQAPAWEEVQAQQLEANLGLVEGALGQGVVIGMLGGFRTLLADFAWLQMNHHWLEKDRAQVAAFVQLTTTLDPRPQFFWLNGARMLAYDMPVWRIREAGGFDVVPQVQQDMIYQEQAEQAFVLLEKAMEYHPESYEFDLEIGQIYLNRLKDNENAAKWFLSAWEKPGAPFYTGRIYAELLRRQGQHREAYEFLCVMFAGLPDDNPYANKGVVLERIRELERLLNIPMPARF